MRASGSSTVAAVAREHKFGAAATIAIVLVLIGAASYGVYALLHRPASAPFEKFTMSQATSTGKAVLTAISPDGKFILTVQKDQGQQSLWLRNIPTGSDTQVVASSGLSFGRLTFSPDGSYFYFRRQAPGGELFDLLRAPVLGGQPEVIAKDVDSNAAVSPDGTNIDYKRATYPERSNWRLLEANADGSAEKVLLITPGETLPHWLSWSPDGKRIALAAASASSDLGIEMFDLASGKMNSFVTFNDKFALELAWAPDGRSIYIAYPSRQKPFSLKTKIGVVSYPAGKFRTIVNDVNNHTGVSVSADGRTLATVQDESASEIDILRGDGTGPAAAIPGIPRQTVFPAFDWTADGQLLVSEGLRLVRMNADGSNAVTLLSDSDAWINDMMTCDAGQHIALAWFFHGGGIIHYYLSVWRASADGSNLTAFPLHQVVKNLLACDGKWLYYLPESKATLMRISSSGGEPEVAPATSLVKGLQKAVAFSPDGKTMAIYAPQGDPNSRTYANTIALLNTDANSKTPPRYITTDPRCGVGFIVPGPAAFSGFHFTPDGKAIAILIEEKGVDNIWIQPIDGSKGHQLTHFDSLQIQDFRWSPDGKRLAVIRSDYSGDVVLLHDTSASQ